MTDRDEERAPRQEPELEYRETTRPEYAEWVAEQFTIEEPEPGTQIVRGPCPRCRTVIDIPVVSAVFRLVVDDALGATRAVWGRKRASAPNPQVEPMMCTCEDPHLGRPQDYVGCGAYWNLTISPPPGQPTPSRRPDRAP